MGKMNAYNIVNGLFTIERYQSAGEAILPPPEFFKLSRYIVF